MSISEASLHDADHLLQMYQRMRLIRRFEQSASMLYRATEIPGFLHLSIGQEASAVGACWHLLPTDVITSTHRGHGHCLAKGLDAKSMFAELMGKETGTCRGRGGSMHIADPRIGIFGANGIVGAGLPIAAGAATAAKLAGRSDVTVAFFGDGAVAQGMFHEAVNLAAVWQLPVVFLCENNHYAEFSPASSQHRATLAERARGYGIPYTHVDGNDVLAVADAMESIIDQVRSGSGPILVEAETYRWHGHYEGDPQTYRSIDEIEQWKENDPLTVARRHLESLGIDAARADEVDAAVEAEVTAAIEFGRSSAEPAADTLFHFVTKPRPEIIEQEFTGDTERPIKMMGAIRKAIADEMGDDPSVYVAGIDVAAGGNVFGLLRGLTDEFPGRVLDTPISESAILGSAVGAAMAGARPVVEVMYMDFIGVCLDALLNQAAKLPFMTGGRASVPLVVRTQIGAGRSSGSQHSQSLEALLAHVPGLTVVMPSNPADAYGLLRAAIQDDNPVVFVENRLQYGMKGLEPPTGHLVPLGRAKVVRQGADVTLVSYSRMLQTALNAAEQLAQDDGIDVEVIDLRTIAPLDRETILESLAKTHRLAVAHEAVTNFGVGAEIAALAANEGFWSLDAPVVRIAPPSMPAPYAPSLEKLWLPDGESICASIRKLVRG